MLAMEEKNAGRFACFIGGAGLEFYGLSWFMSSVMEGDISNDVPDIYTSMDTEIQSYFQDFHLPVTIKSILGR